MAGSEAGTTGHTPKLAFVSSGTPEAEAALAELRARHPHVPPEEADVVVVLGGDGFMLDSLRNRELEGKPFYGMNCGTIGFLMNAYSAEGLDERLARAEPVVLNPLKMTARDPDGRIHTAHAFNEVALLRAGPQAAKLRITVDGRVRMDELVCDGALVATPAGSTAYNYSAHGPILPIGAEVLALTAVAAFRPRRWRGAILPMDAHVRFDVLEPDKRPVMADADGRGTTRVVSVDVEVDRARAHTILFDPGHGLEERLIAEQFT